MNGYEVFCTYQAVKLHFTTDTYCYFKYNGKVATKPEGFEKRKDIYMFHRLARELKDNEVVPFMVSNFIIKDKTWTKDLISTAAMNTFRTWQEMRANLEVTFDKDIGAIKEELDKQNMGIRMMFDVRPNKFPVIWVMMNHGEISCETIAILHGMTGMLDGWDKQYGKGSTSSDYIYEKSSRLIRKYEPFLGVDVPRFKQIALKHLTS
jgi:hypothetical protein